MSHHGLEDQWQQHGDLVEDATIKSKEKNYRPMPGTNINISFANGHIMLQLYFICVSTWLTVCLPELTYTDNNNYLGTYKKALLPDIKLQ